MTFYLQFLKMWKSIVGCLLFPFLDKSIPCIVLWKSKYGNRYYCLNRNTFSIFRKVVPQKEKEKTKFGKQVLFPNRDILWKPNENHKKTTWILCGKLGIFFQWCRLLSTICKLIFQTQMAAYFQPYNTKKTSTFIHYS